MMYQKIIVCIVSALFTVSCVVPSIHAVDHVQVVLLGGQSNMNGLGSVTDLPSELQGPQSDVLLYANNAGAISGQLVPLQPASVQPDLFGPEVTFGRAVADSNPGSQFALLKYASGGTNLQHDWNPNTGPQYAAFKNTVTQGLAALTNAGYTYEIVGMIWMQGESDAVEDFTSNYESNLNAFFADVRSNYGSELKIGIGQLSPQQAVGLPNPPGAIEAVRVAQANVAANDPNIFLVDTSELTLLADNVHFDGAGQMALGEAFAAPFAAPIPEPGTLTLMMLGALMVRRRRE